MNRVDLDAPEHAICSEALAAARVREADARRDHVSALRRSVSRGAEIERLRSALGRIAELGQRCDLCEPTEAPFATHATDDLERATLFLCPVHADEAEIDVEPHEQDTAVQIALEALGIKVGEALIRSTDHDTKGPRT